MSGNLSKWERKRSMDEDDEIEDTTTLERISREDDSPDELLQGKRIRLDDREEISIGGSKQNSRGSSPASAKRQSTASSPSERRSRSSSRHDSPAEVIYELSPDQHTLSPISSGSRTPSKSKSPRDGKEKGRTEKKYSVEEEEGEILSDISDNEQKDKVERRLAEESTHVNQPREKGTTSAKSDGEESGDESSEEESSDEDSEEEEEEEVEEENTTIATKKEAEDVGSESGSGSGTDESSEEEEPVKTQEDAKEIPKVESKESGSSEQSEDEESESEEESEQEEDRSKDDAKKDAKGREATAVVEDEAEDLHKELKKLTEKKTLDERQRKSYRSREDDYARESSWRKESRYKDSGKDRSRGRERPRYEDEKTQERSYPRDVRERTYREERERRPAVKEKPDDSKVSREKSHRSSSGKSRSERSNISEKEKPSSTRPSSEPDKRSSRRDYSKHKSSKEASKKDSKRERSGRTVVVNEPKQQAAEETKAAEEQRFSVLTENERRQFNQEVVDLSSEESGSVDGGAVLTPISDVDMKSDSEDEPREEEEEEEEEDEGEKLPPYLPAVQGCRNVEEFQWLNRIEEGSYGVVYRAKDKRTGEVVALKKLKMEREKGGFPITSLREINTLLKAQHDNIVTVREIVVGSNMDKIYIVMDYVEHDLKTLMEHMTNQFTIGEVKTLLFQLLEAVKHLHDRWILHRDLKTSNLLLSNQGILKVGDFGLAREYGSPLKNYTPIVVTLWYRAPELLLGTKEYSTPIDLWSVGCIFAELLTMKPLFTGKSEIDQINKIFQELGTPSDKIWPGPPAYSELPHVKKMTFAEYPYNNLRNKFGTYLSDGGFDLLNRFLTYDPKKRITAEEALSHKYFKEHPQPVDPSFFPTWPARSELMKRPKRNKDYEHSPSAPEGGAVFAKLAEEGDGSGSGAAGFRMPPSKKGSAAVAGFTLKF